MKIIYPPRGRAREYSELAANLYAGCDHGCTYCYAPAALKRSRDQFNKSAPRAGVIRQLADDADEMRRNNDTRNVLLCFTCDPYQEIDVRYKLTRQAIQIFNHNDVRFTVLTKGGLRSSRDLDLVAAGNGMYAATLTLTDEKMRQQYEPCAAPTEDRIAVLKQAHRMGIPTWVSLEPVIDPAQTFELIRRTSDFVDLFKVGKLNYLEEAKLIDWCKFTADVVDVLGEVGSKFYLKDDIRRYASV